MNFKSAEEWYQYTEEQYKNNELVDMNKLLGQVPTEFREDKIFDGIKIYAATQKEHLDKIASTKNENFRVKYKELNDSFIKYSPQRAKPIVIESVWELDGKQSLTHSIFKHYEETGWEQIDYFMCMV